MVRLKSEKPVIPLNEVLKPRQFIFPLEYATDFKNGKQCMMISINNDFFYIPCMEKVYLTFSQWSLLKNIGKIERESDIHEF
jgi:hypothetical protein